MGMRDRLCIGEDSTAQTCVDQGLLAVWRADNSAFADFPADGIVGLSIDVEISENPFCVFFRRLLDGATNIDPHFSLIFGEEFGELRIGGHDDRMYDGSLTWVRRARMWHGQFWQFEIQRVLVGLEVVDYCESGCRALLASGDPSLAASKEAYNKISSVLRRHANDCQTKSLRFELQNGIVIEFPAEDYIREGDCRPRLGQVGMSQYWGNSYFFGRILFQRYYLAFDWKLQAIGLANLTKYATDKLKNRGTTGDNELKA